MWTIKFLEIKTKIFEIMRSKRKENKNLRN